VIVAMRGIASWRNSAEGWQEPASHLQQLRCGCAQTELCPWVWVVGFFSALRAARKHAACFDSSKQLSLSHLCWPAISSSLSQLPLLCQPRLLLHTSIAVVAFSCHLQYALCCAVEAGALGVSLPGGCESQQITAS
jgi:hypothetical protein